MRIGINTGPVVAGVVGLNKFAYDIWGDAVNVASRMETLSEPGRINISENTYQLIKEVYECESRGKVLVKNKGEMEMYFVNGTKNSSPPESTDRSKYLNCVQITRCKSLKHILLTIEHMIIQDPNNYWEQLERLEKLIRASEFKAGVIFSFHSLILGLFADRLDYFEPIFESNWLFTICRRLLAGFVSLISIYYCFRCFMPRMEMQYEDNVFFFRDAVKAFGTADEYVKRLMEICENEQELFTQLSAQIHAESKIIDEKFGSVRKSLRFFALSFIFAMASLIIGIIQIIS